MATIYIQLFKKDQEEIAFELALMADLPEASSVKLGLYGVVRRANGTIAMQKDYSAYISSEKEGRRLPNGRFIWKDITLKWIPIAERKHNEFSFVFNMYDRSGFLLSQRRSDKTIMLERKLQ